MKTRLTYQGKQALAIVDVLVIVAVVLILWVLLLPLLRDARHRAQRINCASNLKQVGVSFQLWAKDNNNKYPMSVSVTNGGAYELIATGNVVGFCEVMSNYLSTQKILVCPEDPNGAYLPWGGDFSSSNFCNKNISYFVGVDADESHPQRLLCGDDNFLVNGNSVASGVQSLSTNVQIKWASGRHVSPGSHFWTAAWERFAGNIVSADGSVATFSDDGLQSALQQTGLATNRLAIP
ncbi:MAG TPA: hypothetical protein VNU95_12400 [Candidatus Acidoferrales bacterium]|nr:hypothetical protein [Candidatus Acidoferrales bacterium]